MSTESELLTPDHAAAIADCLTQDRLFGDAIQYDGIAAAGCLTWDHVCSYGGPNIFDHIPPRARKRAKPGYLDRIQKGKQEVILWCNY